MGSAAAIRCWSSSAGLGVCPRCLGALSWPGCALPAAWRLPQQPGVEAGGVAPWALARAWGLRCPVAGACRGACVPPCARCLRSGCRPMGLPRGLGWSAPADSCQPRGGWWFGPGGAGAGEEQRGGDLGACPVWPQSFSRLPPLWGLLLLLPDSCVGGAVREEVCGALSHPHGLPLAPSLGFRRCGWRAVAWCCLWLFLARPDRVWAALCSAGSCLGLAFRWFCPVWAPRALVV